MTPDRPTNGTPHRLARTLLVPLLLAAGADGVRASDGKGVADDPRLEPRALSPDRDLTDTEYAAVERRLIGNTTGAVGRLLGKPDSTHRWPDGTTRLGYTFGRGRDGPRGWITVQVKDGRVVSMGHNERQTGVRDDDLVGLVGP